MTVLDLSMSCTGVSSIKAIDFRDGMSQGPAVAEITCVAHTLEIGDLVDISFGYTGSEETFITGGTVRKIIAREPEHNYTITVQDKLGQAVDFFIAPDNPNTPYQAINIKAEDLVVALLAMASITGVDVDTTIFTYGTANPVDIKLVTVWQMVETIGRITGFDTYCDGAGVVHFKDRPAFVTASDTVSSHSFAVGNSGDILSIEYDKSSEQLRNRVVVYGGIGNAVYYTTSAVSPYLPAGFYKTMVVAHPLIDNLTAAQGTGDANLLMFNRLAETTSLQTKGVASIRGRSIVDVTEPFCGMDDTVKWLCFGSHHSISETGFYSEFTLVR